MKITIIGGGNIGTLMAAEIAHKGHEVIVYSSKPEIWKKEIGVFDSKEHLLLQGTIKCVTNNLQNAVEGAEIIWITIPAQLFSKLAKELLPYVKRGQYLGVVPGSGGAEFAFKELIHKGCILFGLQRVHSIARLKKYGESVCMLGRKARLELGAIPAKKSVKIAHLVQEIFDIPCIALPNYLSVTLTPSNPILHTTRLYSMFKDYVIGAMYPSNILFYEEWNDESSKMLIACDGELQNLCHKISMELNAVMSLCAYYDSYTPKEMTEKIRGIPAFKGLMSPMKWLENGWAPDWESRYFTADFSYGLKIIKDICELFDVRCTNIEIIWNWYCKMSPKDAKNAFTLNMNRKDFIRLYD